MKSFTDAKSRELSFVTIWMSGKYIIHDSDIAVIIAIELYISMYCGIQW